MNFRLNEKKKYFEHLAKNGKSLAKKQLQYCHHKHGKIDIHIKIIDAEHLLIFKNVVIDQEFIKNGNIYKSLSLQCIDQSLSSVRCINRKRWSSLIVIFQKLSFFRMKIILFFQREKNELQKLIDNTYQMDCGIARKRVENQKKNILSNPPANWKIIPHHQKWDIWDVWITTELNTPYHSEPFKLIVQFPESYPYEIPKLRLENHLRFFHPNIRVSDGFICENTIKSAQTTLTIRERIDAFITLLQVPNASNPNNFEAAKLYNESQKIFYRKALHIFRGYEKIPQ